MTSEIDVYRSAKLLIDLHGGVATIQASMEADAMLNKGGLDGAAVWRRIVAVINELQRSELKPGGEAALMALMTTCTVKVEGV